MNLAIIPARGGSKRILKKNIKDFWGRPIISYSINAARDSNLFDEVMVSTNDIEIKKIALENGAVVPFLRSEGNSSDYALIVDVLLEVIVNYQKKNCYFENICCIFPTAPFLTGNKLRNAMDMFLNSKADALMPIVQYSYPPLRGVVIDNNKLHMKWPEYMFTRSQDLPPLYHDAGQFYIVRTEALLHEKTLFCKNTMPMFLKDSEVQDIDNDEDWNMAEVKYSYMKGSIS